MTKKGVVSGLRSRSERREMACVSVRLLPESCVVAAKPMIESAPGCSFSEIEVMAVNDPFDECKRTIFESYAPRIKMLTQPNSGLSAARNAVGVRTRGNVSFLDADGEWLP